ncbi:hypothetical protein [Streptomyces prunicolor]|uniref:hypothetical protein n=1 Tax=Streptomyces prunicolor TaxID=67348 RepID=UPI000371150F|nr:hypothetical protein [Streptomyces prunicolor]
MDQDDLTQIAMRAAGLAKKGLMLKLGAVGAVVFLAGLLVLGAMPMGSTAVASTCEDTGPGTGAAAPDSNNSPPAQGSVHQQQIANAKAIAKAAQKLPGRATLIALMTAMQESSMINRPDGNLDSVGLFQQRPTMDWGTKAQIMDPAYATESFLYGRGTNKGLVDVANWQTKPPGDVAQAVQGSAHPELYAGRESEVRTLAKEAGIDLGHGGTDSGAGSTADSDTASGDVPSQCADSATDTSDSGAGGTFTDGTATWKLTNPRSIEDAIAWARTHSGPMSTNGWYRRCLAFVANVYGWNFSGVSYAIDHYKVVPADMRHDGDRHPPPGALMYWDTGHRAGHIAVYLGNGEIASNDVKRLGYIDIVKADFIERTWKAKYVGWTPPYFPKAG